MDKLRLELYHDKMQYIVHSLALAERLLPDPDEVETNALYYLLLTAIESTMDIMAMNGEGFRPHSERRSRECNCSQ